MFVITKLGYQDLGCIILSIEIHLSLEDKNTSTVAVGVSGCDVVVMPPATTNTNSSPYFYKTIVVVLVLIANAIFHNKYFFYQIEMICIFTFVRNGMRILRNLLLINKVSSIASILLQHQANPILIGVADTVSGRLLLLSVSINKYITRPSVDV